MHRCRACNGLRPVFSIAVHSPACMHFPPRLPPVATLNEQGQDGHDREHSRLEGSFLRSGDALACIGRAAAWHTTMAVSRSSPMEQPNSPSGFNVLASTAGGRLAEPRSREKCSNGVCECGCKLVSHTGGRQSPGEVVLDLATHEGRPQASLSSLVPRVVSPKPDLNRASCACVASSICCPVSAW